MSNAQEEKVKKIAFKLARILNKSAVRMLQSALKTHTKEVTKFALETFFKDLGIESISMADRKYWLTTIEKWKEIIEIDWTDEKEYVSDRYDCDNFAGAFSARAAEVYGLNSAGEAWGSMKYNETNLTVGHVFTAIVIVDIIGHLSLYILEPQTDKFIKFVKGQPIIISGRSYYINWILLR